MKELLRITKARNALVTLEGTIYGPEPVSIDPNRANPGIKFSFCCCNGNVVT